MEQDKKLKILLVDDDPLLSKIYGQKFKAASYDFASLVDAEGDFASIVADVKPSLILMDIDLKKPERTGVDAIKILQADERTKSIPFIFLTNGDLPEEVKTAKQMSFLGFIIKADLIPSEVVSKVQELYGEYTKKHT